MTFGSVFNLVWGSGLEFSEIRCRFVINICSNINVTFEREANAIKNTVIRLLLASISDFLIQTGYYIDNHIYFQIKIFYVPTSVSYQLIIGSLWSMFRIKLGK